MAHPKASPCDFDEFAPHGKVLLVFEVDRHGFVKMTEEQHDIVNASTERQDSPSFMVAHVLAAAASVTLCELKAAQTLAGFEGMTNLVENRFKHPLPHPNAALRGPAPHSVPKESVQR